MSETVNRYYELASRPVALPTPEEVVWRKEPAPEAGPGEILAVAKEESIDLLALTSHSRRAVAGSWLRFEELRCLEPAK